MSKSDAALPGHSFKDNPQKIQNKGNKINECDNRTISVWFIKAASPLTFYQYIPVVLE